MCKRRGANSAPHDIYLKPPIDEVNRPRAGEPPRRFLKRSMQFNCAPGARVDYLAHYDMDHTRPNRRAAFLRKVEATFSTW